MIGLNIFALRINIATSHFNTTIMQLKKQSDVWYSLIHLSPFFLIATIGTYLVSHNIFFWDTVQLGARHATFYYENNFNQLLLPNSMDSGHIPTFGMYLALCWKLFGRNLVVSHFSILPFIIGIIWQAHLLIKRFISPQYIYWSLLLFLLDPGLLGQSALVSPDIPLVFFFLYGLNAVLSNKKHFISIACAGLFLISMRGMMVAFALLIIDILFNIRFKNITDSFFQLTRRSIIYIPALIIFMSYNIYHFKMKGWIGYYEDSSWADCFVRANFSGMLFNVALLGWRLMDFGRVFLWTIFTIIIIRHRKTAFKDKSLRFFLIVFLITLAALSFSFIMYKNLSGHRYIMPAILAFSLMVQYCIFEIIPNKRIKHIALTVGIVGQVTGNLWIYPAHIAQGWDSTLAHIPYYNLRLDMEKYLQQNQIPTSQVASFFPNTPEFYYLDLGSSYEKHPDFTPQISDYVIYSNIFNVSDADLACLNEHYEEQKTFKRFRILVQLYKKR